MEEIVLSERDLEYLRILQEECAEVIQICSKIQRFGLYSSNPTIENSQNNLQLLHTELGDVFALVALLTDKGVVQEELLLEMMQRKLDRLPAYLRTEE